MRWYKKIRGLSWPGGGRGVGCAALCLTLLSPAAASACGWWGENLEDNNEEAIVIAPGPDSFDTSTAEGMAKMSTAYRLGQNMPQDDALARYWAKRAAEAGHAGAMNNFAQFLENGIGGPVDLEEAVRWYQNAADLGVTNAQHSLANMYFEGRGVARNDAEGVIWLRRAAAAQHPAALAQLADLIWRGQIPAQQPQEACILWQSALQNGLQDDPERCRKEQPDLTAPEMSTIVERALSAQPVVWAKQKDAENGGS